MTREPGGTLAAEKIRKVILTDYFLQNSKEKFDKYTDTLLYLAARNEHIRNKIKPSISKKKIIICDRFIDSTLAYQCTGNAELEKFYFKISRTLINKFEPNLTILLDIPPSNALDRINNRKNNNKYDKKDKHYFSNVRKSYNTLAKNNLRIKKFNALENKNILANKIKKKILDIID